MQWNRLGSQAARNPNAAAVLLANLVPVAGVLLFGWDTFDVVFVYWLENAVIGFFNVLKMALAEATDRVSPAVGRVVKLFTIPFFVVHYGGFMAGHLVFIVFLLGSKQGYGGFGGSPFDRMHSLFSTSMIVAVVALVAEHAVEFYRDFWRSGRYKEAHAVLQMFQPYGRIIVLHAAILFGAYLIVAFSFPPVMAVLLVAIKTGIEMLRPRLAVADGLSGRSAPPRRATDELN